MSVGRPDGSSTRYSCAIGTIGTLTPASRADIARIHPPALTTISVSISPLSVSTPVTRPRWTRTPVTHVERVDLGATSPRALGEGEGQLARVDVAVGRQIRSAADAVDRHRREEPPCLVGRDQVERQAERLRPARLTRDLLHPFLGGREPQRSDLVPARRETDLGLERPVQVDAVHHHLRQRQRAAQLADEPGRVEGRAARQVGPLDEDDVVPAEPRQPVEDRAAAHAAPDHDSARRRLTRLPPLGGTKPRGPRHRRARMPTSNPRIACRSRVSCQANGLRCRHIVDAARSSVAQDRSVS